MNKFWSTPILRADLAIYPLNQLTADYTVNVNYRGAPVSGATVRLVPTSVAPTGIPAETGLAGDFAVNRAQRMQSITVTTDANGVAKFEAAKLIFGGSYKVNILHPALQTDAGKYIEAYKEKTIVVGVAAAGVDGRTPFSFNMNFDDNGAANNLQLVSISNKIGGNYVANAQGKLTMIFSQPIALKYSVTTANTIAAITDYGTKADGSGTACVAADAPTFDATSATVTATGNVLTIVPKVATASAKNVEQWVAACAGGKVTYTIPAGLVELLDNRDVSYGGSTQVVLVKEN